MKIVVFQAEEWEKEYFRKYLTNDDIYFSDEPLSGEISEEYTDAEILSTFIYSQLTAEVLAKFTNLKMIATRSTGYDHIDLDYCRENGISVANVPVYGENTVAEHVFGLLLTISHKMVDAVDRTRKGDFSQQGLQGFDLEGKTLGVIGTGDIGKNVIKIARGFSMNVIAFDLNPDEEFAKNNGMKYGSFDELLENSDVITLHVPANKHTENLISKEEFGKMKKGVVIINTARGTIVDIQALLEALSTGKVAAVGLDVLPEEPVIREEAELLRSMFRKQHNMETLLANHILLRMRNVYVTPHSAFNTKEAVERILDTTIKNIKSYLGGESLNIVSK